MRGGTLQGQAPGSRRNLSGIVSEWQGLGRAKGFRLEPNHPPPTGNSPRAVMALAAWLLTWSAVQPTAAATFIGTGPLSTPRQNHTMTLLPNGKVLIAGGGTGLSLS